VQQPAKRLLVVQQAIITCERCPRLREHASESAVENAGPFATTPTGRDRYPASATRGRACCLWACAGRARRQPDRSVFTGDGAGGSGDFLMSALHRAGFANLPTSHHAGDGLKLGDAFIAAAVRCAPPDNKPTPEEIATCLADLDAELNALPASASSSRSADRLRRVSSAVQAARRDAAPAPQFAHGSIHPLPSGHILIGCFHPSRQNTNTGKLTARMMDEVFEPQARRSRCMRENLKSET
jgi:uracil-DNA glycosylase